MKVKPYPETHMKGSFMVDRAWGPEDDVDFGIRIGEDGRIWICINGMSFFRFKPNHNSYLKVDVEVEVVDAVDAKLMSKGGD